MCKNEGLAVFRKPLVPLFKVYDLRRNLSDYIEKSYTQSALCFARISVNRQSGHPVKFNGMFPYSLIFNCLCVRVEPSILQTRAYLLRC